MEKTCHFPILDWGGGGGGGGGPGFPFILSKIVASTCPDVISTSPRNFLTSIVDFTVLLLFEFL